MADTKISALATAGTIVATAGTTLSVIVQGGTTKQTPITAIIGEDYEEGAWTPVVEGITTAGSAIYTMQTARYTKTGRNITASCYLAWSGHSGTGTMQISGLPETVSGDNSAYSTGVIECSGVTFTGDYIVARANISTDNLVLRNVVSGGASSGVALATTVSLLFCSVTYSTT